MSSAPLRVLFVCLHGSAKSVIAAEHFRRLAAVSNRAVDVASAGVEPDEQIPPHVVRGLQEDGFDVSDREPRGLTDAAIIGSDVVVSFGCAIETNSVSRTLIRWDDIPPVSDGYTVARDAIVERLEILLDDTTSARARPMHD